MVNVFLKLLHMSITAGWLILAVILVRPLLKKAPKWICCLLWMLVAVRLACPIPPQSIFSMIPDRETIPPFQYTNDNLTAHTDFLTINPVATPAENPMPQASLPLPAKEDSAPPQDWLPFCAAIWAVGTCAMFLWALQSYLKLHAKIRTAVRLQDNIFLSEFINNAFVSGFPRPRIYLPADMPEEMRPPVIAHEQAHYKRRDYIWKAAGYLLLTVYWFHPLCWVAYSLFCKDIELACDEKVVKNYSPLQKKAYSEALLAFSLNKHTISFHPLAFGEVGVKERIKTVLNYKRPAFWVILAALALCAAVALCFMTDPLPPEDPASNMVGSQASSDTDPDSDLPPKPEQGLGNNLPLASGQAPDNRLPSASGQDQSHTLPSSEGNVTASTGDTLPSNTASASLPPEEAIHTWAEAFVNRDENAITAMAGEQALQSMAAEGLLAGSNGQLSFAESDSWPRDPLSDVIVQIVDSNNASLRYYAWSPQGIATVWGENITFQFQDGNYHITSEEFIRYDNIVSGDAFCQAYGYGGTEIGGSQMDYLSNRAGQSLDKNAQLSSTTFYRDLFIPENAAIRLLHLSPDTSEVKLERYWETDDTTALIITFAADGTEHYINMTKPFGPKGIWIPQDYYVNAAYRFSQLDWEEVKRRKYDIDNPNWSDIVLLGRIPEKDISIYGYNDEQVNFQGVAVEINDKVQYFNWPYTSPRTILPEYDWNEAHRQLQIAFTIYTGTGVSSQALHILQETDDGQLLDNVFTLSDYSSLLQDRVQFTFHPESSTLTLYDSRDQAVIAEAIIPYENVDSLELGDISRFVLGDELKLQVEAGFFTPDFAIAVFDNMPVLEVEILTTETPEGLRFDLGEIRSSHR